MNKPVTIRVENYHYHVMENAGAFGDRFNEIQKSYWVETGQTISIDNTYYQMLIELYNWAHPRKPRED